MLHAPPDSEIKQLGVFRVGSDVMPSRQLGQRFRVFIVNDGNKNNNNINYNYDTHNNENSPCNDIVVISLCNARHERVHRPTVRVLDHEGVFECVCACVRLSNFQGEKHFQRPIDESSNFISHPTFRLGLRLHISFRTTREVNLNGTYNSRSWKD